MPALDNALRDHLDRVAGVLSLLIVCDFDGTLADLQVNPATTKPRPLSLRALIELARTPQTTTSVVSGRSLESLRWIVGDVGRVHLFGSHGLESDDGGSIGLTRSISLSRDQITARLTEFALKHHGAGVESKPYGAALHYRGLSDLDRAALVVDIQQVLAELPDVHVRTGKQVIDVSVLPMSKLFAVDSLQVHGQPDVVMYAGDDRTDEEVFASLRPEDISIKVGDGATCASYRVSSPAVLEQALWRLRSERRDRVAS